VPVVRVHLVPTSSPGYLTNLTLRSKDTYQFRLESIDVWFGSSLARPKNGMHSGCSPLHVQRHSTCTAETTPLAEALKTRYTCRVPAHIHREKLANMHNNPSETFHDYHHYAAKIQAIMIKAYSDNQKSKTFNQLAIHHFLQGLQDQNLSYEVIKLKHRTDRRHISPFMARRCTRKTVV